MVAKLGLKKLSVLVCIVMMAGCGGGGGRPGTVNPLSTPDIALRTANQTVPDCDFNSNGSSCDIGDVVKVVLCNVGDISGDSSYDLNENSSNCDIGDIIKAVNCNNQDITCPLQKLVVSGAAYAPGGSSIVGSRTAGRSAAALTGLVAVQTGTTVSASIIDEDGTVQQTLVSSTVGSNGAFSLNLPSSISVVVSNITIIIGTGSDQMRSFISSTTSLQVDPVSEYVVNQITTTASAALTDFSTTELATIYTNVKAEVETQGIDFSAIASVSVAVTTLNANASVSNTITTEIADASGNDVAETLCGATALASVETAKASIFKSSISVDDFDTADAAITSALSASPNCPDANLLGAIIDIVREADRVGSDVLTEPEDIFPIELTYTAQSVSRVTDPIFRNLPRTAAATLDESSAPSEYQTEITSNTLGVLNGAITKLNLVRTSISSQTGWAFTYPKDPANTALGYESLDKNDVDLLTGALKVAVGFVYYALSYNFDLPDNYASSDPCPEMEFNGTAYVTDTDYSALVNMNTCTAADTNGDDILTAAEMFPPSPFGTAKSDSSTNPSNAQSYISGGLSLLATAVDNILDEAASTVGGMGVSSTILADVEHYQHYLTEVASSFGGTTTNITYPEEVECWKVAPWSPDYYAATWVTDPDYNTSELTDCLYQHTVGAAKTIPVNLGAMFSISDFRTIIPDSEIDGDDVDFQLSDVIGNTFGGIFPSGVQSSWFEFEESWISFNVYDVKNASTGAIISNLPTTGITLTVDGVTFTPNQYGIGSDTTYNHINIEADRTTLPTAASYYTVNELTGVTATLSVPGYAAKTITMYDYGYYSNSLTLTPQ